MSLYRFLGSFSKQRMRSLRILDGIGGSKFRIRGSLISTAASMSETVAPQTSRASGQHLKQDTAECPDVGSFINSLTPRLFRRHVRRRAEDDSLLCGRVAQRGGVREIQFSLFPRKRFCQSEVQHLHFAVGRDFDICRLEVPVNDTFLMRGFESLRNLEG